MPERSIEPVVFVRDASAVTRRLAEETVIVPLRNNVADLTSIYTLNETGSFVWELLDGSRDVDQVCRRLTETFDVDLAVARQDVEELLGDLRAAGLIVQRAG